jgi:hypothetical protein
MRKGMMLVIGKLFMIVAAGCPPTLTMLLGGTFRVDGAVPNVHVSIAPLLTSGGMLIPPHALYASKI